MKKIITILLLILFFTPLAFADRNVSTTKSFTSNELVKRGDWKIYRITFVAGFSGASFTIYDSLTAGAGSTTNIKAEGSEATALNGKTLDFTVKPLEGSTGLYLVVNGSSVVLEYE